MDEELGQKRRSAVASTTGGGGGNTSAATLRGGCGNPRQKQKQPRKSYDQSPKDSRRQGGKRDNWNGEGKHRQRKDGRRGRGYAYSDDSDSGIGRNGERGAVAGTGSYKRSRETPNNVLPIIERASSFASSVDISLSPSAPTLCWNSPHSHVQLEAEESVLPVLLKYDKRERGMFNVKPGWLIDRLEQLCAWNDIQVLQALSLRRTHMKRLNAHKSLEQLGLGCNDDVRAAAEVFEEAVSSHLTAEKIPFISEEEQRHHQKALIAKGKLRKMNPTPDFMLKQPTRLKFTADGSDEICSTPTICWLEAKMFFGASTIKSGSLNAVGQVLPKMERYVSLYGPGAVVFSYGCGEQLAQSLSNIGVVALDAHPLDLSQMEEHQREWCADGQGRILP